MQTKLQMLPMRIIQTELSCAIVVRIVRDIEADLEWIERVMEEVCFLSGAHGTTKMLKTILYLSDDALELKRVEQSAELERLLGAFDVDGEDQKAEVRASYSHKYRGTGRPEFECFIDCIT